MSASACCRPKWSSGPLRRGAGPPPRKTSVNSKGASNFHPSEPRLQTPTFFRVSCRPSTKKEVFTLKNLAFQKQMAWKKWVFGVGGRCSPPGFKRETISLLDTFSDFCQGAKDQMEESRRAVRKTILVAVRTTLQKVIIIVCG